MAAPSRKSLLDVLLMVAALVALAAVALTRERTTTGELEARKNNLLASFRPERLERITVERGPARTVIERASEEAAPSGPVLDEHAVAEWNIVEPVREPASFSHVREFVSALEVARVVRRLDGPVADRARFGLDAPRTVVGLELGAITYRLALGGPAPAPSGSRYLELSGDGVARAGVAIVDAALAAKLDVGVGFFRQRKLSPYHPDELEKLVLEREGARVALRREQRRWRFEGMNGDVLVERRLVEGLLSRIGELDAERITPSPGAGGRDPRTVRIVLSPAERARPRVVLEIGGACPEGAGTVAARLEPEPIAGCVDEQHLEALRVTPEGMRSRRPFSLTPDEVEELVSTEGDKRLELVRAGEGFTLRAPRQTSVELETGNRRLAAVVEARGTLIEGADLQALGLAAPRARIIVRSSGASDAEIVSETVDVGASGPNGHVHLLRHADGAVLRVDAETGRAFLPDATLLEKTEILELEPRQIRRVEIEGTTRQTLEQTASGEFALIEPAGHAVDAALAADLVDALAELRAERWVADEDDGSFGLGAPSLRVKLTALSDGGAARDQELVVGAATAGGAFAQISGRTGVFVLSRRVVGALDRWLLDRSGFSVDPAELRRIELEARGARFTFERVGETFEQVEGPAKLDAAAAQQLALALQALRPEAALHPGPAREAEAMRRPELEVRLEFEPGGGGPRRIRLGAGTVWRGALVNCARIDSVDATFVVARERVRAILDLLG